MNATLFPLALVAALAFSTPAAAGDAEYTIVIKDNRFQPAEVTVPAGKRVKLVIHNQDPTAEEFESHDLKREKVIAGNSTGIVWVGPLDPGSYAFVGEFHENTAKGTLVAN
jgi:plastocyanin